MKKPYDTYVLKKGWFNAIEFKDVKAQTIRGDIVQDHQIESLREVSNCGGHGCVVVFLSYPKMKKSILAMSIADWLKIFQGKHKSKSGLWKFKNNSIKLFDEILTPYIVEREKLVQKNGDTKTTWNFARIFGA